MMEMIPLNMTTQDCGKPWYVENYIAFFTAIRAQHPHMRLISNCDMGDHAPTDLFDWHLYTDSQNMFDRRHDFDHMENMGDKQIFASEFGVVGDPAGTPISFPGNARVRLMHFVTLLPPTHVLHFSCSDCSQELLLQRLHALLTVAH